ncbi:MAG TPA: hypothetical protein ENJ09_05870 [Planctomycetes bacterium]|nr:hypothetical protein [Planctomycetota bacterium]
MSHFTDDTFVETGSQVMTTPVGRRAAIPVVNGSNLVTRTWIANPLSPGARAGADGQSEPVENNCATSSWIVTQEVGSRIIEISGTPMRCGKYLTDASAEVMAGQEFTGSSTLSVGVMSEVGASLKSIVAKVGSKVGATIQVDTTTGTTRTKTVKGAVGVHQGATLDGGECFNAELVNGIVMKTFRILHVSREVCPDGSIERVTTNLGELEVATGLKSWWKNLALDQSCPGCAGSNPIPPKVPGTPMF